MQPSEFWRKKSHLQSGISRVLDFIREQVLAVCLILLLMVRSQPPRDMSSPRPMSCSPGRSISTDSLKGQNTQCLSYSCQILPEYFINSFLILRFMLHPYGPEENMCKKVQHITSRGKFIMGNSHHEQLQCYLSYFRKSSHRGCFRVYNVDTITLFKRSSLEGNPPKCCVFPFSEQIFPS